MRLNKVVVVLAAGLLCVGISAALAQSTGTDPVNPPPKPDSPRGEPGAAQGGGPGAVWGGPKADPEQMKKMMEDYRKQAETRMKDALGVNDDEWKVLQPRIEKVQTVSMQARGMGGMGGMFVAFGGPGAAKPEPSDVDKKFAALRKLVKDKEAKVENVAAALKELRAAREAAKAELEKAVKDLKEVLTVKQEAFLVSSGMMD